MPTYLYTTKDAAGAQHYGYQKAKSADALTTHLSDRGLVVFEIERIAKVNASDLSMLCLQLSILIRIGIPTAECLTIAAQHMENRRLKAVLENAAVSVASGATLSESLSKHPSVFNGVFIAMVQAGERGHTLSEALQRLSTFIKLGTVKRRRTASMLAFSAAVAFLTVTCTLVFLMCIFPRFVQLFKDMGIKDPPEITFFVYSLSVFLTTKWYLCIAEPFLLWAAARLSRKSPKIAEAADTLALNIPVLGKVQHLRCISNFSRTLGMLLASGASTDSALEKSASVVSNKKISSEIRNARTLIADGAGISEAFGCSGHFPPAAVHIIGIGEQQCTLDTALAGLADACDKEAESTVAFYSTFLEVGLLLFFALSLATMAVATFLPLNYIYADGLTPGKAGDN